MCLAERRSLSALCCGKPPAPNMECADLSALWIRTRDLFVGRNPDVSGLPKVGLDAARDVGTAAVGRDRLARFDDLLSASAIKSVPSGDMKSA